MATRSYCEPLNLVMRCIREFSYLDFVVNLLDMIQWNPLKHKFHVASDRT